MKEKLDNRLLRIVLMSGIFFIVLTINAQNPVLKTERAENGNEKLCIEHANPGQWYLLFESNVDGTYTFIDGKASSTDKILFSEKIHIKENYVVFEYDQLPDPRPLVPDNSKLIQKKLE